MRVAIDTDVLPSGLRSETGASRIIPIAVLEGVILSLINVSMLLEYEDVLKRPENLAASGLTLAAVDSILDDWVRLAEPVDSLGPTRPNVRDPNDAAFAAAAVEGLADALVTFNIADYRLLEPAGGRLPVDVIRPGEFLRRVVWRPATTSLSPFLRT